jgi:hypothetical protein
MRSDYALTGRTVRQGIRGQYDEDAEKDAARLREVMKRRAAKVAAKDN